MTYYIILFLYCFFRIFPVDKNKICVTNFNGKGYSDNPKYIVEELIKRKLNYKIVWCVRDEYRAGFPREVRQVRYKSIKSIYEEATAKIWIDNCRKQAYVRKRRGQFYIQTWHGEYWGGKKIEKDAESQLSAYYIKQAKHDSTLADLFLSPSEFRTKLYRSSFWYNGEILECGSPRDDILIHQPKNVKEKVLNFFNVEKNTKVILYAPTFREKSNNNACDLDYELILDTIKKHTGQNWIVFVRMHPNVLAQGNEGLLNNTKETLNVTNYADMQELMLASDMLITDYSGCMYEFALMKKPVFLYIEDYEDYEKERGFYIDLFSLPFPWAKDMGTLLYNLKNFNYKDYLASFDSLLRKAGSFEDGKAASRAADRIITEMLK